MSSGKLDYDKYVVSEVFPVSVLDQDTGDSYPLADNVGFAEEMCKLLNEFNEEKLKDECRLKRKSRKITDLANFNVELMEKNKELKAENEQLKKQIGNLEHTKDFCAECCERLEKENEQLKSEIRKVKREYEQLWMHTYK